MNFKLTEDTLLLYAAKHYMIQYQSFSKTVIFSLAERLILNHMIAVFNAFGIEASLKILELKLEDKHWPIAKPFLLFLNYIKHNDYIGVDMNKTVVEKLRKI